MIRSYHEWRTLLNELGVWWLHDENPRRPHAKLTSGFHSNGFFNGGHLLNNYPRLARELCFDLVELKLGPLLQTVPKPDIVIGPGMGAITLARDLADALNIGFAYGIPTKGDIDLETGKEKKFLLERRFNVRGKVLLATEDTITTGDSVQAVIDMAEAASADNRTGAKQVVPVIAALCNRSGHEYVGGRMIVAMFDTPMPTFDPGNCPYCAKGSIALRPREDDNWSRLSAVYD